MKQRIPVWRKDQKLTPLMQDNCPIRERTADGVSVGRCMHYLGEKRMCPIHGDVSVQREHFIMTGELSEDPRNTKRELSAHPQKSS